MSAETISPTEIQSPDCSQFLYRPSSVDSHISLKGVDEFLPLLSMLLNQREGKVGTTDLHMM